MVEESLLFIRSVELTSNRDAPPRPPDMLILLDEVPLVMPIGELSAEMLILRVDDRRNIGESSDDSDGAGPG